MSLAGRRILVTGGAGFIGSHIVESLVHAGAKVRVYDNFSSGLRGNLLEIRDHVEIIEGDILNGDLLEKAMEGMDIVSHQAAQLEITKSIEDPIGDLTTNTIGTLRVFHAALKQGVRKIVNASSACIYGQAMTVPEKEDDHPTNPNWSYGVSKLAAEKYGHIFTELHRLPVVSLRYGIVYGPREWYGRVLTIFLKRALEGKPLIVFGDGSQERDFTFVRDVVALHNLCIEREEADGQIFNASTGVATSVRELAELVKRVTGISAPIEYENVQPGELSKRLDRQRLPSELQIMVLSPEKAGRLLGWTPTTPLEEGLRMEWEWLQQQSERWTVMSY